MGKETGAILGEISTDEVRAGRPMLSAVAVKTTGRPGPGFFPLAKNSGALRGRGRHGVPGTGAERRLRGVEAAHSRVTGRALPPSRGGRKEAQVAAAADNQEAVRDRLIEVARNRGLVTYGELEPIAKLRARRIGSLILDKISRDEVNAGRPMLSAVVINADTGRSGGGFYRLAREIGRAAKSEPDDAIWMAELEAAYEYWAS